jgi:dihydroorotase
MLMAVKRNLLTLKRMIEVTSVNPARIFNLKKGLLAPGYDADMIITGEAMEIRKEKLHSKAGWTPFYGMKGIFPKMTISRGIVVFEDGEIIGKRGCGRFISGQGFLEETND